MIAEQVLAKTGQAYTTIHPPQKGYRNNSYAVTLAGGEVHNLILYKSEPGILARITAANRVSNYLAAHNLPTRRTLGHITKIQGRTRTGEARTKYACLYNYLPGNTIPWEAYTMDHIKLLGLAMSRLHAALAQVPAHLPSVLVENRQTLERMQRYFAQPGVTSALTTKLHLTLNPHALTSAHTTLSHAANLPDHQPLHLDFVRGNILFGTAADHPETPLTLNHLAITGIIDFEKTAIGPRIFDIARTLAFLLVDCKGKTPRQVLGYFLDSGYNKRGPIRFTDSPQLLQALVNFYLLHDLYKFLRHNPYESLPQNEHFVRTVMFLQTRNLIAK
jgi:Ser/Thr protein kinase RdoA (MazF antagonist)